MPNTVKITVVFRAGAEPVSADVPVGIEADMILCGGRSLPGVVIHAHHVQAAFPFLTEDDAAHVANCVEYAANEGEVYADKWYEDDEGGFFTDEDGEDVAGSSMEMEFHPDAVKAICNAQGKPGPDDEVEEADPGYYPPWQVLPMLGQCR